VRTYQSVDGAGDGRVAGMKPAAASCVKSFVGEQDGRLHSFVLPRITGIACKKFNVVSKAKSRVMFT
jgi:hypothetical protein